MARTTAAAAAQAHQRRHTGRFAGTATTSGRGVGPIPGTGVAGPAFPLTTFSTIRRSTARSASVW